MLNWEGFKMPKSDRRFKEGDKVIMSNIDSREKLLKKLNIVYGTIDSFEPFSKTYGVRWFNHKGFFIGYSSPNDRDLEKYNS